MDENENENENENETVQEPLPDEVLTLATAFVSAVKEMMNGDGAVQDISSDIAQNVIDNNDWNEVFQNHVDLDEVIANVDLDDAVTSVLDNIDWRYQYDLITTDEVSEHIDIWDFQYDIEQIVSDCDTSDADAVADQVMEWIDDGCSSVDEYCAKIITRGLGGERDGSVILERDEYDRIMKAVNRLEEIGIVEVQTAPPTAEDLVARAIEIAEDPIVLANFANTHAANAVVAYNIRVNSMSKPELVAEADRLGLIYVDENEMTFQYSELGPHKVTKANIIDAINNRGDN